MAFLNPVTLNPQTQYAAREILGHNGTRTGIWHYTRATHNGKFVPVGYCNIHCRHTTPAEALAHYKQWLIGNIQTWNDEPTPDAKYLCAVTDCGAYTSGLIHIKGTVFAWWLCQEHRTITAVEWLLTRLEMEGQL